MINAEVYQYMAQIGSVVFIKASQKSVTLLNLMKISKFVRFQGPTTVTGKIYSLCLVVDKYYLQYNRGVVGDRGGQNGGKILYLIFCNLHR